MTFIFSKEVTGPLPHIVLDSSLWANIDLNAKTQATSMEY